MKDMPHQDTLRYTYRLRPLAADTTLTLLPQSLKVERTGKTSSVAYADIAAIWLSFMPRGAYLNGYRAKIYVRDGKTITLDDTTFASFFTQARQGPAYRAFVLGLIEKVQAANPRAQIMGGRNFWVQMATIVFGAIIGGLLPFMTYHSFAQGQIVLGLCFAIFAIGFGLWTWMFIKRNRLRNLRQGVPEELLPAAS